MDISIGSGRSKLLANAVEHNTIGMPFSVNTNHKTLPLGQYILLFKIAIIT